MLVLWRANKEDEWSIKRHVNQSYFINFTFRFEFVILYDFVFSFLNCDNFNKDNRSESIVAFQFIKLGASSCFWLLVVLVIIAQYNLVSISWRIIRKITSYSSYSSYRENNFLVDRIINILEVWCVCTQWCTINLKKFYLETTSNINRQPVLLWEYLPEYYDVYLNISDSFIILLLWW